MEVRRTKDGARRASRQLNSVRPCSFFAPGEILAPEQALSWLRRKVAKGVIRLARVRYARDRDQISQRREVS